jgi:restriction endonuclease S subunit
MEKKFTIIGEINSEFDVFELKSALLKNDAGVWGDEPSDENAIGVLRSTNFTNQGLLDLSDVAYRSIKPQKLVEKQISAGDIIIERSGGSDTQPVGRVGFISKDIADNNYVFANFIQRIALNDSIEPKYLFYCLQQMYEMGITASMQYQTTGIRNLDWKLYTKSVLPKPQPLEQKAIASILSTVDSTIQRIEKSINASSQLKIGLMQSLFTGNLKPDGSLRKAEEFYKDEKFGNIPIGWVVKKGNKITDKITKGQSPKWQGFEYQTEGVLFVTSENVLDGYIDVSEPKYLPIEFNDKIKNSQLYKGDILINIVGASIGRCAVYQLDVEFANTNQAVCVFRLNSENDSDFIAYYIQLEQTQQRLLGNTVETARANLSLGDFRKFKFIIPETKEEQRLIAAKVKEIDDIYFSKHEKIKTLQRLKKSLMQNLLTGKVRVDLTKIEEE